MSSHDILGEMIDEARWIQELGEVGRRAAEGSGGLDLDDMLAALMEAHDLRRRLAAQLAREERQDVA